MNIALIGYGKMGKEIEAIALKRNHTIVLKVDKDNADTFILDDLKKADVAIEFSTPDTVVDNIKKCIVAQVPIVVGTTGWYDKYDYIKNFIFYCICVMSYPYNMLHIKVKNGILNPF